MFKILTEEEYGNLFPNNDNFKIEEMDGSVKEMFLRLTSFYRYMLIEYLAKTLDLEKYDHLLTVSNLKFLPIEKDQMDIYQYFNSDRFKYIYLRNNVYISNLNNNEISEFSNLIAESNMTYNDKIKNFIEKTFKKVISENPDSKLKTVTNFGPISPTFMAPDNSLVLGIRYDEFNYNGQTDIEWDNNHNLQIKYLESLTKELVKKAQEKLNIECRIIKYNELSVIKRLK